MKQFDTTDGREICFTKEYLRIGNEKYEYLKIGKISHRGGNTPAFVFEYGGQMVEMPYNAGDKEGILKYFKAVNAVKAKQKAQPAPAPAAPPQPEPVKAEVVPPPVVAPAPSSDGNDYMSMLDDVKKRSAETQAAIDASDDFDMDFATPSAPKEKVENFDDFGFNESYDMPKSDLPQKANFGEENYNGDQDIYPDADYAADNDVEEFYREFVGEKKADDYIERFAKIENGGKTFNIFAALPIVGSFWLVYRRMIAVFLIVSLGESIVYSIFQRIANIFAPSDSLSLADSSGAGVPILQILIGYVLPMIIVCVVMGFLGDKLYKRRADKCYEASDREHVLRKYGGTKVRNVIILALITAFGFIAFIALLALLVGALGALGG